MTDIELLPLPEGESSSFGNYEVHTNETMTDYARACVEANTEALRAEIDALRTLLEDTVRDSTNKIEELRAEVVSERNLKADAIHACALANVRAELLAEALRIAKEAMLSQVKWEACDCGCPQGRKPADAVSVTWLRAVQQVEIATARAEEGK